MRKEPVQGHVLGPRAEPEPGQIIGYRDVEPERASLHLAEHREGGERLGHGADLEERPRLDRTASGELGLPERLRPERPLAIGQRDRQAGDAVRAPALLDERAEARRPGHVSLLGERLSRLGSPTGDPVA